MADADNAGMKPESFRIGAWTFVPAENELRDGDTRRRLEHRAARTLDLLCRARGGIVGRETIVQHIWNGRLVSPNSLSIVISDLRDALGDDARTPIYIETIAKRGYKLRDCAAVAAEPAPAVPAPARLGSRRAAIAASLIALLILAALGALYWPASPRLTLVIPAVVNETGNPRLDPLARASNEVLIAAAGRIAGAAVVRASAPPAGSRSLVVTGRLVMWSGQPTLMLSATDPRNGRIVWQGIGGAGEDRIPPAVEAAMRDLAAHLPK